MSQSVADILGPAPKQSVSDILGPPPVPIEKSFYGPKWPDAAPSPSLFKRAENFAFSPLSPPAAVPSMPEDSVTKLRESEMGEFQQQLEKQYAPKTTAGKAWLGTREGLASLAEGFRSPVGAATFGTAGLPVAAQRAISLGFAAQMIHGAPELARRLGEEFGKNPEDRDTTLIANLLTQFTGTAAFSSLAALHGLKPRTKGVPNAGQNQEAAALHGNVRAQPESTTELPAEESSGGVQPRTAEARQEPPQEVAKETQLHVGPESLAREESVRVGELTPMEAYEKAKVRGYKSGFINWKNLSMEDKQKFFNENPAVAEEPTSRKEEIPEVKPQKIEQINLTGLDPEHQALLKTEMGNTDVPVEPVSEKDIESNEPFVRRIINELRGRGGIATIDRKNNRIVFDPKALNEWLNGIPKNQRQTALRSLIGEERIHLATDDAAATTYWRNLTGLEQAIVKRRYGADTPGMNDTLWGHEALRFRMQQLSRMTPREIAEAVGQEKWTLKGLTIVETAIRGVREALGTKASRESLAILDTVQKNIDLGRKILSSSTPGAVDKHIQEHAEEEAKKLEEQAKMYIESGDVESGNELNEMAKKLRGQTGEQYFPMAGFKRQQYSDEDLKRYNELNAKMKPTSAEQFMSPAYQQVWKEFEQLRNKYGGMPPAQLEANLPLARPKKRQESKYQEKFILPGMETHQFPGTTKAVGNMVYTPEGEISRQETPATPLSERPTSEELKLPQRPTGAALEKFGSDWMDQAVKTAREGAAARAAGASKEVPLPKFNDFVSFIKSKNPAIQPGHLREMWQNMAAKAFEDLPGDQLRELGKSTFSPRQTIGGIEKVAKTREEEGELAGLAAESRKEGRASIWDRRIPDKAAGGDVIDQFRKAEKAENDIKAELDQARNHPGTRTPGEITRLEGMRKDATHARMRLKEGYEDAIRGQNWRNRVVSALYRKMVKPQLEVADAKLNRKDVSPDEIRHGAPYAYEDIYKATAPKMEEMLRDTGGRHVQGTAKFGRSSSQAQNVTKRLLVIQNPRSGTVHMVDVYPRGDEIRVLDPISPTREHVVLPSILNRYRSLYTVLLDEPVRNFRKDYKNLPEYMRKFGRQAEADKRNAASYEPTAIPESEFIGEVGGRIAGSEEGHLQGPHKKEVTEAWVGEHERGETIPITDAEASALFDHISQEGDPKTPSDVENAIRGIDPAKNRQAFSAIAKLGRAIGKEFPFATPDELVDKLSTRITGDYQRSKTLDEFRRSLGAYIPKESESEPPPGVSPLAAKKKKFEGVRPYGFWISPSGQMHPVDSNYSHESRARDILGRLGDMTLSPHDANMQVLDKGYARVVHDKYRNRLFSETKTPLTHQQRTAIRDYAIENNLPAEHYQWGAGDRGEDIHTPTGLPMASDKQKNKQLARNMENDIFHVSNQHIADVEQSFDEAKNEANERATTMPASSVKKINDALDEEHTLGKTDIKLTPNEANKKVEYDELNAQNHEMYAKLKGFDPDTANPNMMWSRMAKDPNSVFQQYLRDIRRSFIEGWFSHRRTFKALTDDQGNRHVVAVVKEGKNQKLVAYHNGKGTDLGKFAWGDLVNRQQALRDRELAPIKEQINKLAQQREALRKTVMFSADDEKRLADIQGEMKRVGAERDKLFKIFNNGTDSQKEIADAQIQSLNHDFAKLYQLREEIEEGYPTGEIKKLNSQMAELYNRVENVNDKYPDVDTDDKVFVDKNGQTYKMGEATIREIESNTDTRYYSDPYAVLKQVNLSLKAMLREATWLENFKKSPEFQTIARARGDTNIPPEWFDYDKRQKGSDTLPFQLRGYIFEPRIRDVLNQFHEQRKMMNANMMANMNKFLQDAVFFSNPFLHTPNLSGWWFTQRGALNWLNPTAYPRLARSFTRAFMDVANKTPEYVSMLRAGTPLQYTRMRQFGDNIMEMLQGQLKEDPTLAKKIANFLGYANPVKLSQAIGHAATAGLHDVLTMQLMHEMMARHPGMSRNEAMMEVTRIMPDYRVPSRVMGQRAFSRMIRNPNILWFGAYHYAEGKAFTNLAKGLVKGEGMTRGAALDKIAAIALLSAVAYPIMDDLLKKITGRKDLAFRRAGPTTWPTAAYDVATGARTPTQVMPSFVSISPSVVIPISLLYNTALGGKSSPIYNPRGGLMNAAGDIASYTASQVNQGRMLQDLKNGKTDWETVALNLAGIRRDYSNDPASKLYGWAYDYAKKTNNQQILKQFNERAMEVYPPSQYSALKADLASGNQRKAAMEIRRLMAGGLRPDLIERELRVYSTDRYGNQRLAHPFSGLQDTESQFFDSLSPEQKRAYMEEVAKREKIYQNYLELVGQ